MFSVRSAAPRSKICVATWLECPGDTRSGMPPGKAMSLAENTTKEDRVTITAGAVDVDAARAAATATIDANADDLVRLSKFIHAHPEVALEEVQSSAACADFLEEHGFAVARGVA